MKYGKLKDIEVTLNTKMEDLMVGRLAVGEGSNHQENIFIAF